MRDGFLGGPLSVGACLDCTLLICLSLPAFAAEKVHKPGLENWFENPRFFAV